jgi:hypothetical protein
MAIAWPLAEHAQKTAKIPRLDFFLPFTPADAGAWHFFCEGSSTSDGSMERISPWE